MLYWTYIFLYLIICIFISFVFHNKSLLQLLLLSEIIIILLFTIFLTLASYFNLYFLIGFSFFLLIFGGLELSLNILLLTL
jgi:hypothetical protein